APAFAAAVQTLIAGAVALLIGLLLAMVVARQITRPVSELTRLAAAPDGDVSAALPPTGLRETDEVVTALHTARQNRRRSEEEEQRARAALSESEEVARRVLDNALDAYIRMDQHGVITEWNAMAEAVFGWTRSEAIGQSVAETIIPPDRRTAHWEGLK